MDNNNNKRSNDGRKSNKRKPRVKIIKDKNLPAPLANNAKKDRAKLLSKKAISNIFGSEDAIWEELASQAMGGSIKAMEMLLTYQYGKAGENKEVQQSTSKAPIIQFNVSKPEETIDTIDLTEEE
jgi:hypothetical protein|tara:strand:+ start:1242 stop:1616 length:375 start_codon:yes stop_codon:yes gene_type:complete